MINKNNLPRHVAVIMDGNGRWAKKRHLSPIFGHRAGAKTVDRITTECAKLGIEALTLYSFSTENWKRSEEEVEGLMNLLFNYLEKKYNKLQKNGIRLNAIGKIEDFPKHLQQRLSDVIKKTADNKRMVLTLALNYGGRQEIVNAAKSLADDIRKGSLRSSDINESVFSDYLYTRG
ncbi:polyprenyl diphosphate synthase, partial [Candidatus Omnitrophota bacterium]